MKSLHDPNALAELLARARKLQPTAKPLWGSLSVGRMLCHVSDAVRVGLGELDGVPVDSYLRSPLMSRLVIYVLPWPKGAPSFKEAFTTEPRDLDADVEELARVTRELSARGLVGDWPSHPLLGRIGGRGWSRLMYRHIDHHLRQFGV